jgi:hypothetical protein
MEDIDGMYEDDALFEQWCDGQSAEIDAEFELSFDYAKIRLFTGKTGNFTSTL